MKNIKHEENPNSIKYYVKKYISKNKTLLKNKTVIDCPAGNGVTSEILKNIEATPLPVDIFPEYFNIPTLSCTQADIVDGLPLPDECADFFICQEGIEHFTNQYKAFCEFNRTLKLKGTLLITTPNYSNLRARISYLLTESERFGSIMPPNEMDTIWMKNNSTKIYFGHAFLIGIQKLRLFAAVTGFKIKKIHSTKIKSTSLFLLPLLYPFIIIFSIYTYFKALLKHNKDQRKKIKTIYTEQLLLNLNFKILLCGELFIEFEKTHSLLHSLSNLKSRDTDFGTT